MRKDHDLYFIAIVPPSNICAEVTGFKEDFATRFNSKHALKVIPHITLKAPFSIPKTDHEHTLRWFENMPLATSPFKQQLKDFGAFHNKRNPVIFVHPVMNSSLQHLQKEVLLNFAKGFENAEISKQELEFNPHMTVGYRDLQPHLFKEAWKEYEEKKYAAEFDVDSFHLLQHDSKKWNMISTRQLH